MPHRIMIQPARLKTITQGSIFNFARSDDFSHDTLGMVISARCDVAQKKQEKYIYIPLVRAKEWIDKVLVPKIFEEQRKSVLGELKGMLKNNNQSDKAIDTFGAEACMNLLQKPKEKERYGEKLNQLHQLSLCLDAETFNKKLIAKKTLSSRIDEVVANKVEGYFFVDQIIDYQNQEKLGSHIAILGEPRPIHKNAALQIAEGLDHSIIGVGSAEYESISRVDGEMSYVLCNLKSPYIELVLQRFSNFYSRIGIDDHSKDLKEILTMEVMA